MTLKIACESKKLADIKDQCIVIGLFEDNLSLDPEVKNLDKQFHNVISSATKQKKFKGVEGQILNLYLNSVILIGLGKKKEFSLKKLTNTLGNAARAIRSLDVKKFSVYLNSFGGFQHNQLVEMTVMSIYLSLYQYNQYKTKDLNKIKDVDNVTLIVNKNQLTTSNKILNDTLIGVEAVAKTRDLVNTPPNVAVPEYISQYAKKLAQDNKIKCTILNEKDLEKLGMNCYMAVARASVNNPRMVILEYNGAGKNPPIVLVGKGITYDTGGINTKPANYMATMKSDKSGACNVLHIIEACVKLKLKINVIGIGAFAENAVSGNAYKPDDVLKSYSGLTVEVIHSDAEGRMVLADTLSYALLYKPKAIIDMATLTGAAIVAVGYVASPIMGNNQKLVDSLIKAGEKSLDKLWQLPLWDDYEVTIKSDIADIKHLNTGDMDAGTIIGGIFLKQFVKDVPWAHLDIAGTAFTKESKGYKVKGGTGFGVMAVLQFLKENKF